MMDMIENGRTPNYVGTYYLGDPADMEEVAQLQRLVKNMNKMLRESGYRQFQYRVTCQGRGPRPSKKYYQSLPLSMAERMDVYIHRRSARSQSAERYKQMQQLALREDMGAFKNYLVEFQIEDLDLDFVKRAEKVTTFNLTTRDMEDLKYKKEIQFLFKKHFFPNFDLKDCIDKVDMNALNNLTKKLKTENKGKFNNLFKYNLKGIGPGEVLMYFLINKAHLGGGSSAGVDLVVVGDDKYEIKAVSVSPQKYVYNFKVGGTLNLSPIVTQLLDLKKKAGAAGKGNEIPTNSIRSIAQKFPIEFKKVQEAYRKETYNNYFRNHSIIFMNNSTSKIGEIVSIKDVKRNDIEIDAVTSGTIKPRVRI